MGAGGPHRSAAGPARREDNAAPRRPDSRHQRPQPAVDLDQLDLDLYATVFDVARIGICVIDEQGRFVRVNPFFCELVRHRPEDLIGQHYSMSAPPSVVAVKEKFLAALFADSPKIPLEWGIRRSDGSVFDSLVSFRPITRADGRKFAVVTFSDISESRRSKAEIEALNRDLEQRIAERTAELTQKLAELTAADDALRHSEERLQVALAEKTAILEHSVVGIGLLRNRRLEWCNRMLEEHLFGYPRGSLTGKNTAMLYPSREDYERLGAEAYPLLAQGRIYETRARMKRSDGSLFWCLISGRAIQSDDPALGSIWVLMDITSRRKLEEDLRRTLSEREAILQSSVIGIALVRNREYVWVNQHFECDMLGYRAGELVGQSVRHTYGSPEAYDELGPVINRQLVDKGLFTTEGRVRRKDGSTFWCLVSGCAIDRRDLNVGTIWTVVDLSRRKAAEAELVDALAREKELNELKSRFVSMTSHEFRTPLATILSSTELLADYGERLTERERADLIGGIKGAVQRMTRMLEDILLIGRSEAGRLEFRPRRLDLRALCQRIVDETRAAAHAEQQVLLRFENVGAEHVVDEELLRHILGNLLTNAIKYSPTESTVDVRVVCDGREILLEVEDRGIGIPIEDQARLFETFHRGRNVNHIAGAGLGLAIVRKSVELHGGRIAVSSAPREGSKFTVVIPEIGGGSRA